MTSEDLSGTHRKSALQLDVEVLERRVVELEHRLSEMAIEVAIMRLLMLLKTGGKRRRKNNEERGIVSRYLLD